MSKSKKSFNTHDTFVGVWADKEMSHPVLYQIFAALKERGFQIGSDPRIDRDYPILSKDHFKGSKGDLLFEANKYPAGFKIEFYQEINTENRNGGKYDFDKFNKMPYLIKKQFELELSRIKEILIQENYTDESKPKFKTSFEKVMYELNSPDRHWGKDKISDYNAKDKDGILINNGHVKYFRDRKGVLMRGVVFHNINNMWWVVVNKSNYRNLACFELFNLETKEENSIHKLVNKSGHHNPLSRFKPTEAETKEWLDNAKKIRKEGRIDAANKMLNYLYEKNWLSRSFNFNLKSNGRLALFEIEGKPFGSYRKFDEPKYISLDKKHLPMSSTESSWVRGFEKYVRSGKPSIGKWFCTDRNGEGSDAHHWADIRVELLKIGAMSE